MKVLVVDDEPLARRRLVRMLEAFPDVAVCGEAGDAAAALERVREERPDVVLLDIRMPGLSGLELAAGDALPPVVFTTAHDEYAVEAFEVSAVDYLLKPVERERLAVALEKARARSGDDAARLRALLERLERVSGAPPPRLHARSGRTTRLVDASGVTRLHASEKVTLLMHDGRELVLDESLDALEARLREHGFLRVHRAELVNLAHVRALHTVDGATRVELADGQSARVSRRSLGELKQRLGLR